MGHELPQGQWSRRMVRPEIGKVIVDGGVEVDPSLFDKLHDPDVGKELRDGADPVNGLGGGGAPCSRVLDSKTFGPHDSLVLDERDGEGWNLLVRHLEFNDPGQGFPGRLKGLGGPLEFVERDATWKHHEKAKKKNAKWS